MARSLEQIIAELDPGYAGSRNTIQSQIDLLPGQTEQQLGGLQAQAQQSHEDILSGARRRGLGFSGIPVGEQFKYDATTFKPAVANLYSSQNQRKMSLDEALNMLFRDQRTQASGIQQGEIAREDQERRFQAEQALERERLAMADRQFKEELAAKLAEARAERASKYQPSFGGASGGSAAAPEKRYIGNDDFRGFLAFEAQRGNRDAAIALNYVGNDGMYHFDPTKKNTGFSSEVLNALDAIGARNAYKSSSRGGGGGGW